MKVIERIKRDINAIVLGNCASYMRLKSPNMVNDNLIYGYGGKPACCVACGNPAYPECKYSCPMFDD